MKIINEPKVFLEWIKNTLITNYYGDKDCITNNLKPSTTVENFVEACKWIEWDWLILLLAVEVKFSINITDEYSSYKYKTLGEFCTMLSCLPKIKKIGWSYNRIKLLGEIIYADSHPVDDSLETTQSLS